MKQESQLGNNSGKNAKYWLLFSAFCLISFAAAAENKPAFPVEPVYKTELEGTVSDDTVSDDIDKDSEEDAKEEGIDWGFDEFKDIAETNENIEEQAEKLGNDEEEFNESFLLLKVTSADFTLSNGISAYSLNDRLYISLFEVTEALYFPIEVFDEEQRAEGWFISPDNDFYLSIPENTVIVAGKKSKADDAYIKLFDEEIYVDSEALKEWFGLNFNLNLSQMILDIEADEKLAFQEKAERAKKWEQNKKRKKPVRKTYSKIDTPYSMLDFPSTTVQLGTNYQKTGTDSTTSGNYSIQGTGDLLNMSSDFFVTGNDTDRLSDARIKLYRIDNDANIIPHTDIRKLELGDITTPSLNLVGGGGTERGISATNRPLGQVSNPDNFIISGEVEQGWEVELYRNNEFISFQDSTSDGRYEFRDVLLEAGMNLFKIIKYGPFGEKEEEYRRFFIGPGMLKEGEFFYDVSASQPNQTFLPVNEDYDIAADPRLIANFEYGVSKNLSVGAGLYSGPIYDKSREGAVLSARTSILGAFTTIDHLHNTDGTFITSASERINLGDFNISASALYNGNFDITELDQELTLTGDIGTAVDIFGLMDLNLRLGTDYESYQSGREVNRYGGQVSTNIMGFALSNKVDWVVDDDGTTSTENAQGQLFFRKRLDDFIFDTPHDILIRTTVDYDVTPDFEVTNTSLRLEKNINEEIRVKLDTTRSFGAASNTTVAAGVSYDHEYFSTNLTGTTNSQGDYALGLNLRFHLDDDIESGYPDFVKVEDAQRGKIVVSAYLDNNINGVYDQNDTPLENIDFKTRDGHKGTTNAQGMAVVGGLTSYKTTDIYVIADSMPDIFYVPIEEGYTLVPRSGSTTYIDFPIVLGGEVDGFIELEDEEASYHYDFSQITLELVNASGVVKQEISPDVTGYYIFSKVVPGKYTVRISEESKIALGISGDTETNIDVDKDDPVVTDLNFIVGARIEKEIEEEKEGNENEPEKDEQLQEV